MVHYDSCIKIHNTYINTNHLFYNKLVHLANKCSEITNSHFFQLREKEWFSKSINEFVFVSRTLTGTRHHSSRVKDAMINIKDPG